MQSSCVFLRFAHHEVRMLIVDEFFEIARNQEWKRLLVAKIRCARKGGDVLFHPANQKEPD